MRALLLLSAILVATAGGDARRAQQRSGVLIVNASVIDGVLKRE